MPLLRSGERPYRIVCPRRLVEDFKRVALDRHPREAYAVFFGHFDGTMVEIRLMQERVDRTVTPPLAVSGLNLPEREAELLLKVKACPALLWPGQVGRGNCNIRRKQAL